MFKCPSCNKELEYVNARWSVGGQTDISEDGTVPSNYNGLDFQAVDPVPEELMCPECGDSLPVLTK